MGCSSSKQVKSSVVADVYKPPPSSFAVFDINSIEEPWLKLESDIAITPLQDDLDEKPPRPATPITVLDTIEAANAGAGDDAPKTWDEVSKALETHLKPAVAVPAVKQADSLKSVMLSVKSPAVPPPQSSPSFHTLEELEAKTKRDSPKPTTIQLRKTESSPSESNQTESTQTNTSASKLLITGSRSVKENIFVLRDRERREKEGNKKPVMNWDPLREYPEKCPPGGGDGLVVYTTSLQGVRRTYEDCMRVRAIMEQQGVVVDERDVALDAGVLKELKELLDGATTAAEVAPPRVFIKGRYLGGAAEVTAMNENGKLGRVLRWARVERIGEEGRHTCEGCGGARWVPCLECGGSCKVSTVTAAARGERWERCVKCNENGLIRCPVCFVSLNKSKT